jgi:hypothetical protein
MVNKLLQQCWATNSIGMATVLENNPSDAKATKWGDHGGSDGNKIRRYLEVSEVAYHSCKDARLDLVDVKLHIVIANLPTVIWF